MRAVDVVNKLCPRANAAYIAAFEAGDGQMSDAGITTPTRLAHFLAQVMHETGGLTVLRENMNYTASRIRQVWPSRPNAVQFAGNPEGLANSVYGGRMGNTNPGDGWKYRGRGLMQTTGREAYAKYGKRCGVPFESDPDLVLSAEHALKPALAEWVDGKCNEMADRGDIAGITLRINGGTIGLADRRAWFAKVEAVLAGKRKPAMTTAGKIAAGGAAAAGGAVVVKTMVEQKPPVAAPAPTSGAPWDTIGVVIVIVAVVAVGGFIAWNKWGRK